MTGHDTRRDQIRDAIGELRMPLILQPREVERLTDAVMPILDAAVTADTRGPFDHDDTCPDQPSGRLTAACDCGQREAVEKLMAASSGHDIWRDQIVETLTTVIQDANPTWEGLDKSRRLAQLATDAVMPHLDAAVAEARAETARAAAAAGWDAAVAAMQYEDGQPVEIAHVTNPYRQHGKRQP